MARRYVIDANATLGLFLRLPYSENMEHWMLKRQAEKAVLIVPILWEYECLTGFRRAVTLGVVGAKDIQILLDKLFELEFQRVSPTIQLHHLAWKWAEKIGQSKANDAQYLAVAESLAAEFWTADKRLVNAASSLGIDWVHHINES